MDGPVQQWACSLALFAEEQVTAPLATHRVRRDPGAALVQRGLSVDVRVCRGICVVTVCGTIDRGSAASLRTALIDAIGTVGPRLVLDLFPVVGCDDAGLEVIAAAGVRARRRGGWLRIAAAAAPVAARLQTRGPRCPVLYATVSDALVDQPGHGGRSARARSA